MNLNLMSIQVNTLWSDRFLLHFQLTNSFLLKLSCKENRCPSCISGWHESPFWYFGPGTWFPGSCWLQMTVSVLWRGVKATYHIWEWILTIFHQNMSFHRVRLKHHKDLNIDRQPEWTSRKLHPRSGSCLLFQRRETEWISRSDPEDRTTVQSLKEKKTSSLWWSRSGFRTEDVEQKEKIPSFFTLEGMTARDAHSMKYTTDCRLLPKSLCHHPAMMIIFHVSRMEEEREEEEDFYLRVFDPEFTQ